PQKFAAALHGHDKGDATGRSKHCRVPHPASGVEPQTGRYVVEDRSSKTELERLRLQDHMSTIGMGGVLLEQTDPTSFKRVLDVGCATGEWLLDTAEAYPTIRHLVGVDISKPMIEAARAQAQAKQLSERVEFYIMDALRMLEFPAEFFDLVNHRA